MTPVRATRRRVEKTYSRAAGAASTPPPPPPGPPPGSSDTRLEASATRATMCVAEGAAAPGAAATETWRPSEAKTGAVDIVVVRDWKDLL